MARQFALGAQDPGTFAHGTADQQQISLGAGHDINARYWRLLVPAGEDPHVTQTRIGKIVAAGYKPILTIGGAFNGGVPSKAQVKALAPMASVFTIYNEPDYKPQGIDPKSYRKLFTDSRAAIKAGNPKAQVLLGDGLTNPLPYLKHVGNVKADGLAFHPYPLKMMQWSDPAGIQKHIDHVMGWAKDHGMASNVWATETGTGSNRPPADWSKLLGQLAHSGVRGAVTYNMTAGGGPGWDTALMNNNQSARPQLQAVQDFARNQVEQRFTQGIGTAYNPFSKRRLNLPKIGPTTPAPQQPAGMPTPLA